MRLAHLAAEPDWKQYIRLGEQLLSQPNAAAQVALISQTIQQLLGADVRAWLKSPFFPLPGEPAVDLLSQPDVPALAQAAAVNRKVEMERVKNQVRCAVFPMVTQDFLLGVLQVSRPEGPPFDKDEITFLEGLAAHAALALQINRQVALKNWRYEQLLLVRTVSSQIANEVDIDKLAYRVTGLIQKSFNYYYVALFTWENEAADLHFRASADSYQRQKTVASYRVSPGQGIIGKAALSGEEHLSQNVISDPDFRPLPDLPDTKAEIAIPLKVENRVLGVLDVQSDQNDGFHENDLLVLRSLADTIALAVEGTRLYSDLARKADQIRAVYEVSRKVNSILEIDPLLSEVVNVIHRQFGFPYVHLFTVHAGRRKIFYRAGCGIEDQRFYQAQVAFELDAPRGIVAYVGREGKTYLANDVSNDPYYQSDNLPPDDTRSELAIPLVFGNEIQGVLDIQSTQINAFSHNDVDLLEALSASIAVAMHNASMYTSELWRRQVAESFRDVATQISANVPLDTLLDMILQQLEKNLPCEISAIWLLDQPLEKGQRGDQSLRLAAARGAKSDKVIQARSEFPLARDWLEEALYSDEPVIRQPGDPVGPLGIAGNFPEDYSSLAAPLRAGDQVLGAITLAHSTPGRYGSEAKRMTATFASYAAVAIQNARLYAEAQQEAWTSAVLLQVAEASQSTSNIEDLLATMARITPLLIGVKKCAIFLCDEAAREFTIQAVYGLPAPLTGTTYLRARSRAFELLTQLKSPILVNDPESELGLPEACMDGVRPGTVILLPLAARGELLGAMLVGHQDDGPISNNSGFTEQTLSILQGIAHQTAIAVENIKLLEARQEDAYVTAVLLQVAQAVVSQKELDDILDTIVNLMPILVGIDTCIIYLLDSGKNIYSPVKAYCGSRAIENEILSMTFSHGEFELLDNITTRDQALICESIAQIPARFLTILNDIERNRVTESAQSGEIMGFPLSVKGEVFGVLVTRESGVNPEFRDRRIEIMTGVAQQIALAIQNEKLNQEMVGRERLEKEFQLAREIQRTFLPKKLPDYSGWAIDIRWQTAREVGGDFYDVFPVDKDYIGVAIADVSDKGMPAALYMTVTRTLLRSVAVSNKSPSRVLNRVNHALIFDEQNTMFVTLFYGVIRLSTGEMVFANAGHNRPYIYRADQKNIEKLDRGGMALGVMERITLQDDKTTLRPGDLLLLYTDGVTESFSPENDTFGDERLAQIIKKNGSKGVCRLLEILEKNLDEFRAGEPPSDDLTILAIQRLTD